MFRWLFGLDNGLSDDIDTQQFQYFAKLIRRCILADETVTRARRASVRSSPQQPHVHEHRVIICTHEPDWILGAYDHTSNAVNVRSLIALLGGRVALRLAGMGVWQRQLGGQLRAGFIGGVFYHSHR